MESGRIEPLRALPVHREAQPCLQPPQWAKYVQCTLIFPLMGNTPNPRIKSLKRRLRLENPLQTPPPLEAPAPEAPGGSLEAPRVLEPPKNLA